MTASSSLRPDLGDVAATEVAAEQAHVDRVYAELAKADARAASVAAEGLARGRTDRTGDVRDEEMTGLFERDALMYAAARRRATLEKQYEGLVFGRLDLGEEHSEPDFTLAGRGGAPLIDPASHVAMAHPSNNGGVRMLRRGYNYTDGSDGLGRLDAGLFFVAFVRDPATQYVPMQTAMARSDLLVEYLRHTGSGLFAVPPGVPDGARLSPTDGAFVGQQLFA